MSEVWRLPTLSSIQNNGREWLLNVLEPRLDVERSMVLFTLWRSWHIRNEVVHHKPMPTMEASKRFLVSYLNSILCLKVDLASDPEKGKQIITCDKVLLWPHEIASAPPLKLGSLLDRVGLH